VKGETSKQHIGNAPWKFAKIIPTELWYFDDRFFDEERQLVPKDLYT
jgi:hypothetical protein